MKELPILDLRRFKFNTKISDSPPPIKSQPKLNQPAKVAVPQIIEPKRSKKRTVAKYIYSPNKQIILNPRWLKQRDPR